MTSNAPSAARLRHAEAIEAPRVDAASFRQGWRVRTRLDALLAAGRITGDEWLAAVEYRDAYARVWSGRSGDLAGAKVSGGADLHDRQIARIATLTLLADVERRIGALATALCVACVVEDMSWAAIAALCRRNPETVRDWTALAVRTLASAWATREGPDEGPRSRGARGAV
jgi:hypothetical protein